MMQIFSRNVIWPLSQIRVIFQDPSETTDSPPEVLGQRPGAFAQFRHVTAGTKQGPGRITPTVVDGNFGEHSGRSPQYP